MKNMKTIICLLLGAVLALGLLAGCGAEKTETPATTQPQLAAPTSAGMLLVNFNAAIEIIYDTEGFVMDIRGADTNGEELLASQDDLTGDDITVALQALTKAALADGYLIEGEKAIVIKQALGSSNPGTAFMNNIYVDVTSVSDGFPVFMVTEDMLDEMGYMTFDACRELLAAALMAENPDEIELHSETENNRFVLQIPINDRTEYFTVDYNLGTVRAAELTEYDEDAMNGVEPEEVINPNEEKPGDNEPFPEEEETQAAEEEDIVIDLEQDAAV